MIEDIRYSKVFTGNKKVASFDTILQVKVNGLWTEVRTEWNDRIDERLYDNASNYEEQHDIR